MKDKALGLMGLCRRARRMTIGADQVCDDIRQGNAVLVCAAADVSPGSIKKVERLALEQGIPMIRTPYPKEALSIALGKTCGVLCVTDKGFADKIRSLLCDGSDTSK